MYCRIVSIVWLVMMWPFMAGAETPLTWDDCVRELIRQNPDLQAAQAQVEKARADVIAAYAPFLPQISANANATRSNTELDTGYADATSYQASLSAYQSLFAGFRDRATLDQTRAVLTATEKTLQRVKADLSYTLRTVFARYLYARDYLQLTELITSRRKENVNLVELRFQAGRENKGSFLRSQAFFHQAEFDVTQARRALIVARRQMATLLNRPDDMMLTVAGEWVLTDPPAAPPRFIDMIAGIPDHQVADAQWQAAQKGVRIAQSAFYPEWSANASVGRSDDSSVIPDNNQWSVGTMISFPVFSGGQDYYGMRSARAAARTSQAKLVSTDNQLLADLEDKFAAWQDVFGRVAVQAEFLKAAEVRSQIARAQYSNGLLSFEDWDLIENDLIDKQKSLLAIRRDAVFAHAAWEKTTGTGVIP